MVLIQLTDDAGQTVYVNLENVTYLRMETRGLPYLFAFDSRQHDFRLIIATCGSAVELAFDSKSRRAACIRTIRGLENNHD